MAKAATLALLALAAATAWAAARRTGGGGGGLEAGQGTDTSAHGSGCAGQAREGRVIHVDDFLKPGSSSPEERGAQVQAAVDAAVASARSASTALLFGPHEYRLASTNATAHTPIIQVSLAKANAHPLRIDGCGASVVVTTPQAGFFSTNNARRLSVGNITVDYDPLPMTQGWVTAVQSPTRYTLKLDPGFPSLDLPHFKEATKWALVKDKAHPTRPKEGTLNLMQVTSWKARSPPGVFDVVLGYGWPNVTTVSPKLGDPVVHIARYDQYPSFGISTCDRCTFEGITIHASPSASFTAVQCDALVVRHVAVEPKKGRYHATNADGVFVLDSRVGPTVEHSRFVATGDDALITKTFSARCVEQHGPGVYTLHGLNVPLRGDVMWAWNPTPGAKGQPLAKGLVATATGTWGNATITFQHPAPRVPCDPKMLWVNDNQTGPGFVFRNNTIASRRYGVLCMGRDGLIEGNTFEDNPAASVLLINDDDYDDPREARMGWMPRNITIRRNVFRRSSRCVPDPWHSGTSVSLLAVIGTSVIGPHAGPPQPFQRVGYRGASNITIEENAIEGWYRGPAIALGEAHGATVRHNTISGPPAADATAQAAHGAPASKPGAVPSGAAIAVSDAADVVVTGNVLRGAWSSLATAITVDANTTQHVTTKDNTLDP